MNDYLTEKRLGVLIEELMPECELVHNKTVPNSGLKRKPDYRCEKHKIIFEFDGYRHYNSSLVQTSDIIKDDCYEKLGYKVIRVPYFIQASPKVVTYFLKYLGFEVPKDLNSILLKYAYPNGFIDNKALLPADYNELGVELFKSDLQRFWFIADEILQSFEDKVVEKNFSNCLPEALAFCIEDENFRKTTKILSMCEDSFDLQPEEWIIKNRYDDTLSEYNKKELRLKKLKRILSESNKTINLTK